MTHAKPGSMQNTSISKCMQTIQEKLQTCLKRMKEVWSLSKAAEFQEAVNKEGLKAFYEDPKELLDLLENGTFLVLASDGQILLTVKYLKLSQWKKDC